MNIQKLTIWPVVKLSLVLDVIENGSRPPGGVGHIREGVPSLGGEHLTYSGGFNFQNIRFIPEDYFTSLTRGVIQKYDVLVVKDGATTGKTAFVDDNFPFPRAAINEHVFILRPDMALILPHYLFFFLYSEWGQLQIQRDFQGAAIGGINQGFVERLEIPLPPILEQARIVDILHQAGELSQLRQQARTKAESLLAAIFSDMFDEPQQEWKRYKLGDLFSLEAGKSLSAHASPAQNGKWGILKISAVTYGRFVPTENKELPDNVEPIPQYEVQDGDLLISRANTAELVGASVIVRNSPKKLMFPDKLWRVILPEDAEVNREFLYGLLNTKHIRAEISRRATGTSSSMKNISQAKFLSIEVSCPPIDIQDEYSKRALAVWKDVDEPYISSNIVLEKLFQSMLDRAFKGDLTAVWRKQHQAELKEVAAQRVALLLARTERFSSSKAIKIRDEIQRAFPHAVSDLLDSLSSPTLDLGASLLQTDFFSFLAESIYSALPTYTNVVTDALSLSVASIARSTQVRLAEFTQELVTNFATSLMESIQQSQQSFYESLAYTIATLAEAEVRRFTQQPPPQPNRVIHANLDPLAGLLLRTIPAMPTGYFYFLPEHLHQFFSEYGQQLNITEIPDIVQIENTLKLLTALGFVRLVELDERSRYRLIDPVDDGALLPEELQ